MHIISDFIDKEKIVFDFGQHNVGVGVDGVRKRDESKE